MTAKIVEILIIESIAALLIGLAYAIGVKRKMYLIAGYNARTAERVRDKPALARLVARLCLLAALATAIMPLFTALRGSTRSGIAAVTGGYGGFIIALVLFAMLQAREYTRPASERPARAAEDAPALRRDPSSSHQIFGGKENRLHARYHLFAMAVIETQGTGTAARIAAHVENISRTGMGLVVSAPIEKGRTVSIEISVTTVAGNHIRDVLKGTIAWVSRYHDLYSLGVAFDQPLSTEYHPSLYGHFCGVEA